jgi:hypothetical protein
MDGFSAGEVSSRYAQSVGDSIKRLRVNDHLADSVIRALICNYSSHRFPPMLSTLLRLAPAKMAAGELSGAHHSSGSGIHGKVPDPLVAHPTR